MRTASREDGIWLRLSSGAHGAGSPVPVDRVYLDAENRVVQLVEHLDRSQSVEVRCRCASVLEVRTRTIFCSRTRVGDELLICSPEEVEAHWRQIQEQLHGEKQQEMIPCSNG